MTKMEKSPYECFNRIGAEHAAEIEVIKSHIKSLEESDSSFQERYILISKIYNFMKYSAKIPQITQGLVIILKNVLNLVEPKFITCQINHKLRNMSLKLLLVVQIPDSLKSLATQLIPTLYQVMLNDNEVNSILGIMVITNLIKNQRTGFTDNFKSLLFDFNENHKNNLLNIDVMMKSGDAVCVKNETFPANSETMQKYKNSIFSPMPIIMMGEDGEYRVLKKVYADENLAETDENELQLVSAGFKYFDTPDFQSNDGPYYFLPCAKMSMKVMCEFVANFILLYVQLYKRDSRTILTDFVLSNVNTINIIPSEAARNCTKYNYLVFINFYTSQLRIIILLSYYIRNFSVSKLKGYIENCILAVQKLLIICPIEISQTKRDLFIGLKSCVVLTHKNAITAMPNINATRFLDDDILIGRDYALREYVKSMGYLTVADLVAVFKGSFSLDEALFGIHYFSTQFKFSFNLCAIKSIPLSVIASLVGPHLATFRKDHMIILKTCFDILKCVVNYLKHFCIYKLPQIEKYSKSKVKYTKNDFKAITPEHCRIVEKKPLIISECRIFVTATIRVAINSMDTIGVILQKNNKLSNLQHKSASPWKIGSMSEPHAPNINLDSLKKSFSFIAVQESPWSSLNCEEGGQISSGPCNCLSISECHTIGNVLRYGIESFQIFNYEQLPDGLIIKPIKSKPMPKPKDEIFCQDSFISLYGRFHGICFVEIVKPHIDYIIKSMEYYGISMCIFEALISNTSSSASLNIILLEYLIKNFNVIGMQNEQSQLHVKLYKAIFLSISHVSTMNEKAVQFHLNTIIKKSLQMILITKAPMNYLFVLRSLFRSIGGGSHEDIYNEFLPLLPFLLKSFNILQNSEFNPETKELIVELCLTVPVRLSSLLPFLPLLMDPLITALKTENNLLTQGLRTLELCVDNLQPEFLFDHIKPVQTELIQCLWKIISTSNDTMSHMAFRLLGKFGGINRSVLREPQDIEFMNPSTTPTCKADVYFAGMQTPIKLSLNHILDEIYHKIMTDSFPTDQKTFMLNQSWIIIKGILLSILHSHDNRKVKKYIQRRHIRESTVPETDELFKYLNYAYDSHNVIFKRAVSCVVMLSQLEKFREDALRFICNIARTCASFSVIEQYYFHNDVVLTSQDFIKSCVIIDALYDILHNHLNTYIKICLIVLALIFENIAKVFGNLEKVCEMNILEYAFEKAVELCYESAWFVKYAGISMINYILERYHVTFIVRKSKVVFDTIFYIFNDLTGNISAGSVTYTFNVLIKLVKKLNKSKEAENYFNYFCIESIKYLWSPHGLVRECVKKYMKEYCKIRNITLVEHLKRNQTFIKSSIPSHNIIVTDDCSFYQIGMMDCFTFIMSISPSIIDFDSSNMCHNGFFKNLISILEKHDDGLCKQTCYKSEYDTFDNLKEYAIKCLASLSLVCMESEIIQRHLTACITKTTSNDNCGDFFISNRLAFLAIDHLHSFCKADAAATLNIGQSLKILFVKFVDLSNSGSDIILTYDVVRRINKLFIKFPSTMIKGFIVKSLECFIKWTGRITALLKDMTYSMDGSSDLKEALISEEILKFFSSVDPQVGRQYFYDITNLIVNCEKHLRYFGSTPFRKTLFEIWSTHAELCTHLFLNRIYITNRNCANLFELFLENCSQSRKMLLEMDKCYLQLIKLYLKTDNTVHERKMYLLYVLKIISLENNANGNLKSCREFCDILIKNFSHLLENVYTVVTIDLRPFDNDYKAEIMQMGDVLFKIFIKFVEMDPDWIYILFLIFQILYKTSTMERFALYVLVEQLIVDSDVNWKRNVLATFMDMYKISAFEQDHTYHILNYLILPIFTHVCKFNETDEFFYGTVQQESTSIHDKYQVNLFKSLNYSISGFCKEIAVIDLNNMADIACFLNLGMGFAIYDETGTNVVSFEKIQYIIKLNVDMSSVKNTSGASIDENVENACFNAHMTNVLKDVVKDKYLFTKCSKSNVDLFKRFMQLFIVNKSRHCGSGIFVFGVDKGNHLHVTVDSMTNRLSLLDVLEFFTQNAPNQLKNYIDNGTSVEGKDWVIDHLCKFTNLKNLTTNTIDFAAKFHGHLVYIKLVPFLNPPLDMTRDVFFQLLCHNNSDTRYPFKDVLNCFVVNVLNHYDEGASHFVKWVLLITGDAHLTQITVILQIVLVIHTLEAVFYKYMTHVLSPFIDIVSQLISKLSFVSECKRAVFEMSQMMINWLERSCAEYDENISPFVREEYSRLFNLLVNMACVQTENASPNDIDNTRILSYLKEGFVIFKEFELNIAGVAKSLTIDRQTTSMTNITSILIVFKFLISELPLDQALKIVQFMDVSIMNLINAAIPELMNILTEVFKPLVKIQPFNPETAPLYTNVPQLEKLYSFLPPFIVDALENCDKFESRVFYALRFLTVISCGNDNYIRSIITSFVRLFHKATKQFFLPTRNEDANSKNGITTITIMQCLDLSRNTIMSMTSETRKIYINQILSVIIEKIQDHEVLKKIIAFVHEWVIRKTNSTDTHPSHKEISNLLVKLFHNLCFQRYSDNPELSKPYLEIVIYIYKNQNFSGDLVAKLEPIFLTGLRCPEPALRLEFNAIFNDNVTSTIASRLYYIIANQNWEGMFIHFWIKQCIELIFSIVKSNHVMECIPLRFYIPPPNVLLDCDNASSVDYKTSKRIGLDFTTFEYDDFESLDKSEWNKETLEVDKNASKKEPYKIVPLLNDSDCFADIKNDDLVIMEEMEIKDSSDALMIGYINNFIKNSPKYYAPVSKITMKEFASALSQICFSDTNTAYKVWVDMFPQLWSLISTTDRECISKELERFLTGSTDSIQKEPTIYPTCVNCFIEAFYSCDPPVIIRPSSMKHLATYHKTWHRTILHFENEFLKSPGQFPKFSDQQIDNLGFFPTDQQEVFECLQFLYWRLQEYEMLYGLWYNRVSIKSTMLALKGFVTYDFISCQTYIEDAMNCAREVDSTVDADERMIPEFRFMETVWVETCKELNHWDTLLAYSTAPENSNIFLAAECVWRVSNWNTLKDLLSKIDVNLPRHFMWKSNVYRGYLGIVTIDDAHHLPNIDSHITNALSSAIKMWRGYPNICSNSHIPVLYATQQIVELTESFNMIKSHLNSIAGNRSASYHEFGSNVKTWQHRLPLIGDNLSHWNDIIVWRKHHLMTMDKFYNANPPESSGEYITISTNNSIANILLSFAKVARIHQCLDICDENVALVGKIPSLNTSDLFSKLVESVKCYFVKSQRNLSTGINYLDSTDAKYFNKCMIGQKFAIKAKFFKELNYKQEANQCYSAAIQNGDNNYKTWAEWGNVLENMFGEKNEISFALEAITCYLHACQSNNNKEKCKIWIAKMVWMLNYETCDSKMCHVFLNYGSFIYACTWMDFVIRFVNLLDSPARGSCEVILNIILKAYPQDVLNSTRSILFALIYKNESSIAYSGQSNNNRFYKRFKLYSANISLKSLCSIRANNPAVESHFNSLRKIIISIQKYNPSKVWALGKFIEEVSQLSISWKENLFSCINSSIEKCFKELWRFRDCVLTATASDSLLEFVRYLVSLFKESLSVAENAQSSKEGVKEAKDSLLKVYRRICHNFSQEIFQVIQPQGTLLMPLFNVLYKWAVLCEKRLKIKKCNSRTIISNKCKFLRNYSHYHAELILPGEAIIGRSNKMYIHVNSFSPFLTRVNYNRQICNQLNIIGSNGSRFSYIILDSLYSNSNRFKALSNVRIYNLMNFCNFAMENNKNAATRLYSFTIPRFQVLTPHLSLLESDSSCTTMFSIYEKACLQKGYRFDSDIKGYFDDMTLYQSPSFKDNVIEDKTVDPKEFYKYKRRDFMSRVITSYSPHLLKEWVAKVYTDPTTYWHFRKMFTIHYSLLCFMNYTTDLKPNSPKNFTFICKNGFTRAHNLVFDINRRSKENKRKLLPFRFTHNVANFISSIGIHGPFSTTMMNTAICFLKPQLHYLTFVKVFVQDEIYHYWKYKVGITTAHSNIVNETNEFCKDVRNKMEKIANSRNDPNILDVEKLIEIAQRRDNQTGMTPLLYQWF